jgi:hypothetical protein
MIINDKLNVFKKNSKSIVMMTAITAIMAIVLGSIINFGAPGHTHDDSAINLGGTTHTHDGSTHTHGIGITF